MTQTPSEAPWLKRRWRRIGLEVLLVVGVYLAVSAWRERDSVPTEQLAPAFALPSLDGTKVNLSDFSGKTVLLHFWATWCGVCRAEISSLKAIHEGLGPDEVLLTVVATEDPNEVYSFVAEQALPYPIVFADRKILTSYGVSAFPTNYFIDPEGRVASRTVGLTTRLGLWLRMGCAGR